MHHSSVQEAQIYSPALGVTYRTAANMTTLAYVGSKTKQTCYRLSGLPSFVLALLDGNRTVVEVFQDLRRWQGHAELPELCREVELDDIRQTIAALRDAGVISATH